MLTKQERHGMIKIYQMTKTSLTPRQFGWEVGQQKDPLGSEEMDDGGMDVMDDAGAPQI